MVELAEGEVGGGEQDLDMVKPDPARSQGPAPQGQPDQKEGRGNQPDSEQVEIEREPEITLPFEDERPAIRAWPQIERELKQDAAEPAEESKAPGEVEMVAATGRQLAAAMDLPFVLLFLRQRPPPRGDTADVLAWAESGAPSPGIGGRVQGLSRQSRPWRSR